MQKAKGSTDSTADPNVAADFETAMDACGFGIFNILLLFVALFGIVATIFETSTMSYVLPTAECDLKLSLLEKGLLNAMTYAGMILSAVPWGYIADTMGRKLVLTLGLLLEGICVLCGAASQNVTQLMIFKFLGGLMICGPFAVIMSYLSEFHGSKHRSRIMMVIGVMKITGTLILPILAFTILPHRIFFNILGLKFNTWQIFVASTAIPSLVGGILLSLFPESPKFLMTQGRNDEALKAFQTIYAWNKGKKRDSYPVKTLFDEAPERSAKHEARRLSAEHHNPRSLKHTRDLAKESFIDGLRQLKPIFSRPYLGIALLVYFMHMCLIMGQNGLRLWLPQIFASITEIEGKGLGSSSMCTILEYNVNKTQLVHTVADWDDCDVHIGPGSYSNNIIVAASGFVGYFVAAFFVNKLGNVTILRICLFLSCIMGTSLYWCSSSLSILIVSSIFVTVSSVACTTVISASVNIFPTVMRTMVIIMIMTFGRFGSLLGNILFPFFISLGCIPPFVMVGGVLLCAFIISWFLTRTNLIEFS